MTVKELIAILKTCNPDLPIAVHANNHTYMSGIDSVSHGRCRVARLQTHAGDHILIGNPFKKDLNSPNWSIVEMCDGGKEL